MSSKKDFLERHSIKELLKSTLSHTLENIATHLKAFLQTKEPESLHQYRIHIRTARSICLEFSDFMESKRQRLLEKTLKVLQQETNEMRDLDVFLEALLAYKNRLDAVYLAEFEALQTRILKEKEAAYAQFEHTFTLSLQAQLFDELNALHNDEKLCLAKSDEKLFKHIHAIIEKRLKKIAKHSKKLSVQTPNEQFHKLRLHYKKLRYTCDALSLKAFAKSFKPIQSAFGKVQDKNTQIERIKRYNTTQSAALFQVIALLEDEIAQDKRVCIEKSSKEALATLREKFETIFTCKTEASCKN